MFKGDNERHSRILRPHPQVEGKKIYAPCPKSSSYASWRDLSDKDTQQKSIAVNTQRKGHEISQALSVCV